jgi:hypothetical protein
MRLNIPAISLLAVSFAGLAWFTWGMDRTFTLLFFAFALVAAAVGYFVVKRISKWAMIAGYVAIPVFWAVAVFSPRGDEAGGRVIGAILFGFPALACLAGWAIGTLLGVLTRRPVHALPVSIDAARHRNSTSRSPFGPKENNESRRRQSGQF